MAYAGSGDPDRSRRAPRARLLPLPAAAWNIPGHMLSGAIAYQVLQQENPQVIDRVKAVLAKHPWYAQQWQAGLQGVSVADHGLVLFVQAARWPDDIRTKEKVQNRLPRTTSLASLSSLIPPNFECLR